MKNIKYIGLKAKKDDNIAGTGLKWTPGQVLQVPDVAAAKLLEFPGVWEEVEEKGANPLRLSDRKQGIKGEVALRQDDIDKMIREAELEDLEEESAATLPNLMMLDQTALALVAKTRFGKDFEPTMSIEAMRSRLVGLENSRHSSRIG